MKIATAATTVLLTTGAAFAADAPKAPEPAKPIDAAPFYAGRWYEIGRTPMSLTDGCVAGYTDYQMKDGGLYERDACRDKTPDGEEKVIGGPLNIGNPENTKVHVTYHVFLGIIPDRARLLDAGPCRGLVHHGDAGPEDGQSLHPRSPSRRRRWWIR